MTDFAITRAPSAQYYSETVNKRQIQQKFESGKPMSRAAATLAKYEFTTGWEALPNSEWTSLKTQFAAYQGSAINFTAPSGTVYVVYFVGDTLPKAKPNGFDSTGAIAWDVGPLGLMEA